MKIKITVTKEILERSAMCGICSAQYEFKSVLTNCAIALAVRDIFPIAIINHASIFFNPVDNGRYLKGKKLAAPRIPLPEEANMFIIQFDVASIEQRLAMRPFSFEIDVPQSVIDKIGISEVTRILENSETLELVEI